MGEMANKWRERARRDDVLDGRGADVMVPSDLRQIIAEIDDLETALHQIKTLPCEVCGALLDRCGHCKDIDDLIGERGVLPKCEHGKGLTDYCEPCGRVNGSSGGADG